MGYMKAWSLMRLPGDLRFQETDGSAIAITVGAKGARLGGKRLEGAVSCAIGHAPPEVETDGQMKVSARP